MAEAAVATPAVTLTESAAARIKKLIAMEGRPDMKLRLSISGGGCSGFQYSFALDDSAAEDDVAFQQHDVTLVIDETSLGLLGGAVIDFVEDLVGASFAVRNPNASSTCGCGSSFSV